MGAVAVNIATVPSSADREGKGSQPFFNPPARRGVWAVSVRPLDHTRGSTARTPSWGVPLDLPVATRAGRRGSPAREPKCRGPIPLRANVRVEKPKSDRFLTATNRTAAFYRGRRSCVRFS